MYPEKARIRRAETYLTDTSAVVQRASRTMSAHLCAKEITPSGGETSEMRCAEVGAVKFSPYGLETVPRTAL